jgi:hypothetical protein
VHLLRAERGVLDDEPVISGDQLRAFAAEFPAVRIGEVAGTNHYTIVIGPGPGARRVAATIEGLCRDARLETQYADQGR